MIIITLSCLYSDKPMSHPIELSDLVVWWGPCPKKKSSYRPVKITMCFRSNYKIYDIIYSPKYVFFVTKYEFLKANFRCIAGTKIFISLLESIKLSHYQKEKVFKCIEKNYQMLCFGPGPSKIMRTWLSLSCDKTYIK